MTGMERAQHVAFYGFIAEPLVAAYGNLRITAFLNADT